MESADKTKRAARQGNRKSGLTMEGRLREKPLFILPDGSNRDEITRLGQMFLQLTIDAVSAAGREAPFPSVRAAGKSQVGSQAGTGSPVSPLARDYEPPLKGRSAAELVAIIRERVLGRVLNVSHPGYVGHMDTLPSAIGAFSDILISALNNNMLCWEMSPVFTEMEARLLAWMTRSIGWAQGGDASGDGSLVKTQPTGFLVSGGSLANLSAVLAARNVLCGPEFRERGLSAAPGPPVIFASEEVHYSIDKIVNILGLGARGLVRIPTDEHLRMRPDALEEAIQQAQRNGQWPFCVVGIAGTTVSGVIDPLGAIGEIARRHGLWYHVDAAYGGSLLVCSGEHCRQTRALLNGIEMADSVTFNPQKWLFVPKVCAGIFFRDSRRVADAVRQSFPYANSGSANVDDPRRNVGEYTIQGTRRVDILKLWLTLEHFGLDFLSELMQDSLERAHRLARRIEREPCCQLLSQPQLNIVCFRYVPEGWDTGKRGQQLDDLNQRIHTALSEEGPGWVSIPRHRGTRWLRFVILHPLAREELLDAILDKVVDLGRSFS